MCVYMDCLSVRIFTSCGKCSWNMEESVESAKILTTRICGAGKQTQGF